jgi:hypothetical protein
MFPVEPLYQLHFEDRKKLYLSNRVVFPYHQGETVVVNNNINLYILAWAVFLQALDSGQLNQMNVLTEKLL